MLALDLVSPRLRRGVTMLPCGNLRRFIDDPDRPIENNQDEAAIRLALTLFSIAESLRPRFQRFGQQAFDLTQRRPDAKEPTYHAGFKHPTRIIAGELQPFLPPIGSLHLPDNSFDRYVERLPIALVDQLALDAPPVVIAHKIVDGWVTTPDVVANHLTTVILKRRIPWRPIAVRMIDSCSAVQTEADQIVDLVLTVLEPIAERHKGRLIREAESIDMAMAYTTLKKSRVYEIRGVK